MSTGVPLSTDIICLGALPAFDLTPTNCSPFQSIKMEGLEALDFVKNSL